MSEEVGSATRMTVYVRLLNEGTEVCRPVAAQEVAPGKYRLIKSIGSDALDEEWEFPVGAVVRCVEQQRDGQDVLVAVSLAE
ncbi:hypothetical protein [Dongia sedimenti]|uniref:Uncharacterized protein n=1 Tax=Dongia sedimenti TaxID=3064282 RepID=A0ABU0YHU0_9PROT|nr:hypothetical protein [Rhodospirillaceae bacterium R-7]